MKQLCMWTIQFALVAAGAVTASAIDRHPTGVNVASQGATSVFITFGNLQSQRPAEAEWCGELISAAPGIGMRCSPDTVFGRLPARLDLSTPSGVTGLTDIMSIPASVTRRAFQAAQRGEDSRFFYVRRFVSLVGGPDEYVFVTCRMASVGARTPLSLVDARLVTDLSSPILFVRPRGGVPPVRAEIAYTGSGWLRGRWEVVLPGEERPTSFDLLSEASLPAEERVLQRRYLEVARFREFLPPTGSIVLDGPPADRLPTVVEGVHELLLRIEAVSDKEGDSDLGAAGAGQGVVASGGVAGFPMPTLRYVVGGERSDLVLAEAFGELVAVEPAEGAVVDGSRPVGFVWSGSRRGSSYLVEIEDRRGERVLAAIVRAGGAAWEAAPWLANRAGEVLSWRVSALDGAGEPVGRSGWQSFRIRPIEQGRR
jgi:hypothetical protein